MGEYILKSISTTLDPGSIEQAIKEVDMFQSRLKPAMQCLIDYLGEKGVEVAKATLMFIGGNEDGSSENPGYMTGALQDSISYRNEEGVGIVSAGEGLLDGDGKQSYAVYVEYGTGIFGEDRNRHGETGWWYLAPWGWTWTNGMAPRPFMGSTFDDLKEEAEMYGGRVIAEYIRGERA